MTEDKPKRKNQSIPWWIRIGQYLMPFLLLAIGSIVFPRLYLDQDILFGEDAPIPIDAILLVGMIVLIVSSFLIIYRFRLHPITYIMNLILSVFITLS